MWLMDSLVVEDMPRDFKQKRRSDLMLKTPPTNSLRPVEVFNNTDLMLKTPPTNSLRTVEVFNDTGHTKALITPQWPIKMRMVLGGSELEDVRITPIHLTAFYSESRPHASKVKRKDACEGASSRLGYRMTTTCLNTNDFLILSSQA
ncbi:hypothetical protein L1987_07217 [Smallanthus sonchifolius]|uniref:Uncharacterized protein n=1 Tax=Smallanthus sonchifolius TaxID=185202 RepID=A0ACB9K098_9ASTR|nr:hypothetical protein L1987_07217 [Smallanthus sonchifolius]